MGRVVVVLCLLLAACASSVPGEHSGPRTVDPSTPAAPLPRPEVGRPVGLAVAAGQVWAASAGDGTVVAFDAVTGAVRHRVAVGDTPLRVVADGRVVWATVFGAGRVVGIEATTGRVLRTVALPGQPEGAAVGFGSLWVVRQQARLLTRLASTGRVLANYPLGREPRLVTTSGRYVVASNFADGTLTRVDPRTGARATSARLCAGAQDLAAAGTTLWVTCTPAGLLLTVDERTLRVTGRVHIGGEPDGVRVAAGRVLVATTNGPTVYEVRLDPRHPVVLRTRALGYAPPLQDQANVDLVVAAGRVWVSSYNDDRIVVAPG